MQVEPVDLCYSEPSRYRLCDKTVCIRWDKKCPCKADEFECSLGNCIPLELKCDGLKQCLYGEDEEICPVENKTQTQMTEIPTVSVSVAGSFSRVNSAEGEMFSIPVVVTIASVCMFVFVLMVILLYIFITRRQKNNTSRESQSATEPLRKSYLTADVEAADLSGKSKQTSKEKSSISRKRELTSYLPVDLGSDDSDNQINHIDQVHKTDNLKTEESESDLSTDGRNLAINPGAEIYCTDPLNESRIYGLGKYTFKPRLKYMKSKPYHEIDEKDREKLYVINSYKHCSGKSIVPSTLTFDKDPEKFSDKFATDLLCSSTPRQPVKHSVKTELSNSLESITAQSDTEIT